MIHPSQNSIETPTTTEQADNVQSIAPLQATPLAAALGAQMPQSLKPYRGVQTAEGISSSPEEFAALLTSVGVYDLGWRRMFQCSGKDSMRWLNGMVTNSVKTLEENAGCYAFVLNSQGRILGDLDIYRTAESFWIETDLEQVEPLMDWLQHHIIMDKVDLELQPNWTAIGINGPLALETMSAGGLAADPLPQHRVETTWLGHPVIVVAVYSPLIPRYAIWMEQNHVLQAWKALAAAGARPCGFAAVDQLRILEGIPAYGIDITDKDLPQETNQMRALHFSKGCYLGQEIVERIRSRGNVHRIFSGFILGDTLTPIDAVPPAKTPLLAEGKPVGAVTSLSRISLPGAEQRVFALGSIRREVLEEKSEILVGTIRAVPSALPFEITGGLPKD